MKVSFKQFIGKELLNEGGNVVINGESAHSIELTKHDRDIVVKDIKEALSKLNKDFKQETGLYIWKPDVLAQNKIFSGSTKHLFDETVSTDKLEKVKPTFGDVDLMIDIDLKDQIKTYFDAHKFHHYKKLTFIGYQPSGDQLITLWKYHDYGINVQIDFEGVDFKDGEPTQWSHFSHSSHFDDTVKGIKGVFHKHLMTSLMAPKKVESIEQLKTKQKDIIAGTHSLSIKGLRQKFEKIGEQDDKPVLRATDSKDYVRDFNEIFKEVFGRDAKESDIKKFWSFDGMLDLIKKYMDIHEREKVVESFVEKLFGPKAQKLYREDFEKDLKEKNQALQFLEDKLDIEFNQDKLTDMQKVLYKKG